MSVEQGRAERRPSKLFVKWKYGELRPHGLTKPFLLQEGDDMSALRFTHGVVIAAVGSVLVAGTWLSALTSQIEGDVSEDSEIVLTESGPAGYTLRLRSVDSTTTISLERGGETTTVTMPHDECLSLWNFCLERDAGRLEDASAHPLPPDQSEFTLTFRIGTSSHSFSAVAVDFLEDQRYREIIRSILDTCARYVPQEP